MNWFQTYDEQFRINFYLIDNMNKAALLAELATITYVMIKPSPIEGIGVFAIRDIPKGCRSIFSNPENKQEEWLKITRAEIDLLPAHSKN